MNNENSKDLTSALNDAVQQTAHKADAAGENIQQAVREGATKVDRALDPVSNPVDFSKAHESLSQLFASVQAAVRGDSAKEKIARAKMAETIQSLENPAHQGVDLGEKAARHAQRKARHGWKHLKGHAEKAQGCASDCVGHHPMKSLGVAVAAGAILTALVLRSGR